MMRFMRAVHTTTAPSTASAPPERPVPEPRATKGTPAWADGPDHPRGLVAVPWQRTTARGGYR